MRRVHVQTDFKAAGISFNCSTPTSSNGTLSLQETTAAARWSFPRQPLLRAFSDSNAAEAPPSLNLTPAGRQSWHWEGGNGPRNCLEIVPLLEETLYTLRTQRRLPTPAVSVMQSLNYAGPSETQPGRVCVYCGESCLGIPINTYGIKRLNHNIAVFAVTALNMLTDKTALFYPEKERSR